MKVTVSALSHKAGSKVFGLSSSQRISSNRPGAIRISSVSCVRLIRLTRRSNIRRFGSGTPQGTAGNRRRYPPSAHFEPGLGGQDGPPFHRPRTILVRGPVEGMGLKMSPRRAQGFASPARAATLKNDKPGIAIEGPQGRQSDRARPRMLGAVSTRRLSFVAPSFVFPPFNLGGGSK